MTGRTRLKTEMLTLEEFLARPEIDEHPYLEYVDGRVEAMVSPKGKHSRLTTLLSQRLNQHGEPASLGMALVELRCTFGGRSVVPDIAYFLLARVECDANGEIADEFSIPPDIHIEIFSPRQTLRKARAKLTHSVAHGCPLGWLVHPYKRTVEVFRPGRPSECRGLDGILEGAPVLPGLRLPVAELFGWLRVPRPNGTAPGPSGVPPT